MIKKIKKNLSNAGKKQYDDRVEKNRLFLLKFFNFKRNSIIQSILSKAIIFELIIFPILIYFQSIPDFKYKKSLRKILFSLFYINAIFISFFFVFKSTIYYIFRIVLFFLNLFLLKFFYDFYKINY